MVQSLTRWAVKNAPMLPVAILAFTVGMVAAAVLFTLLGRR